MVGFGSDWSSIVQTLVEYGSDLWSSMVQTEKDRSSTGREWVQTVSDWSSTSSD